MSDRSAEPFEKREGRGGEEKKEIDAVLLLSLGGPEKKEEVRGYIERVTEGLPIPEERKREVERQYAQIGGASPINALTRKQAKALQSALQDRGFSVPVRVAFRYTKPTISDLLADVALAGKKSVFVFILSLFQSEASWGRYIDAIEKAVEEQKLSLDLQYAPPFFAYPSLQDAAADQIRKALEKLPSFVEEETRLLFTAHSIPLSMAERSPYVAQFEQLASGVAERVGMRYALAYQSRSGSPRQPWLEPDINEKIAALAGEGVKLVVVSPLGFLCDHAEVLYDLDIRAAKRAEAFGVRFLRVPTVGTHPFFTKALVEIAVPYLESEDG